MLTLILSIFAVCLVLVFLIGMLFGEGRGAKKCDARWEVEWDRRKDWLAQSRPVLTEHATPFVSRALVDPTPPPLPAVVQPVRTEVLSGYRARHSSSEVTGPIELDGDFTQEIKRLTASYYASATAHVLASREVA